MTQTVNDATQNRGMARLLGALVLLFLAGAAAATFLVVAGVVDASQLVDSDWSGGAWLRAFAQDLLPLHRLAIATASLVVGILALVLLVRSLGGGSAPSAASLHMLASDDHGFVVVESRGIVTVARQAALSAPGVVEATVQVDGDGTSPVGLKASVGVYPGAKVKDAGDAARDAIRDAVENLVGLKTREVLVTVRVIEPDRLSRMLA